MTEMSEFIAGLPKAELHMHIEGALEPAQKFEMAARNALRLPYQSVDDVRAAYDFDDLPTFLDARYEGDTVLVTELDFYELAMGYYQRVAAETLVYAEIFFDPQAHTSRGVSFGTVIRGLRKAQEEAAEHLDVESQLIMCFLRDHSVESAAQTLEQAEPYREWIVGIGLDSDEQGNPPLKFKDVYRAAADQGYRLTAHCDVDQENSVTHIWQALDDLGVERIDHGLNSLEDPTLMRTLADRNVGLTLCPISNRYVVQDSRSAAIKPMLDAGMAPTINSDDPAYFGGYMNANLEVAQADGNLTVEEVTQLARNAFSVSWTSQAGKDRYLAMLDAYLAATEHPTG